MQLPVACHSSASLKYHKSRSTPFVEEQRRFCWAIRSESSSKDHIKMPKRSFRPRLPPISAISENEPHAQKSRFTAHGTESQHAEDHHSVQSTTPATKSAHRRKAAPISCTCHEKSTLDLDRQNTRFPLRLSRKVITKPENAQAPQRERSLAEHPLGPTRFCEPAQSKCTSKILRRMNAL